MLVVFINGFSFEINHISAFINHKSYPWSRNGKEMGKKILFVHPRVFFFAVLIVKQETSDNLLCVCAARTDDGNDGGAADALRSDT